MKKQNVRAKKRNERRREKRQRSKILHSDDGRIMERNERGIRKGVREKMDYRDLWT